MNAEKNCAFVFVVCGNAIHIQTLNFSITPLIKKTQYPIYVVTDLSRNDIAISEGNIIDVKTPESFTNHQAAIYLKTSLHKVLPQGVLYCYLDSDILAIGNYIDDIFFEFRSPIIFAEDHCTSNMFSPAAMQCGCIEQFEYHRDYIYSQADEFVYSTDEDVINLRKELNNYFKKIKLNILLRIKLLTLFLLSRKSISFGDKFLYYPKEKVFTNRAGKPFMRHYKLSKVAKKLGYKWSYIKKEPLLPNGYSVWRQECIHLHEEIKKKFDIDITDKKFRHYNGGVFLFNHTSHSFLDCWHTYTMAIFNDDKWKTRDQGTLMAATWKFNIQNTKPLDKRWNLIVDYNSEHVDFDSILQLHQKNNRKKAPQFLHVYHHFQDTEWEVWKKIEQLL